MSDKIEQVITSIDEARMPQCVKIRRRIFVAACHAGLLTFGGLAGAYAQNIPSAPASKANSAQTATAIRLSPDVTAKAKVLQLADNRYLRTLCSASSKERAPAKETRDTLRDELNKLIARDVSRSPDVRRALDAAAEIGEKAYLVTVTATASEQDKLSAQSKFQQARSDLLDVAAREKNRIDAEIVKDFGLLTARDVCPDDNKAAARQKNAKPKISQARGERRRGYSNGDGEVPAADPGTGIGVNLPGVSIRVPGLGLILGQ